MRRHETPGHLRFLTFSCYRRLKLLDNDRIRQLFVDQLVAVRDAHDFKLVAWVVMPEHVHLLIFPRLPDAPVAPMLLALKRPVARRVLGRWRKLRAPILGRITDARGTEHFWQAGGGYDRNIYSDAERREKINYIRMNPVRRGLVALARDWPWSSARRHAGEPGQVGIERG